MAAARGFANENSSGTKMKDSSSFLYTVARAEQPIQPAESSLIPKWPGSRNPLPPNYCGLMHSDKTFGRISRWLLLLVVGWNAGSLEVEITASEPGGRVVLRRDAETAAKPDASTLSPQWLFGVHGFQPATAWEPDIEQPISGNIAPQSPRAPPSIQPISATMVPVQPAPPALIDPSAAINSEPASSAPLSPQAESKKTKDWFERYTIRGYAQVRFNEVTHLSPGSAPAQYVGDSSIGEGESFLIRRARLVISGDVTDNLAIYLQSDFANTPPGSSDSIEFAQMRDWYADIYLDDDKEYRFRVGQSKIPYGWEDLQSSQNRIPLDRNDALDSAVRNERDLGVLFYWTPVEVQRVFKFIDDNNLKGSGNYGSLGLGLYNGQGGSMREENDNLHFVGRFTWPFQLDNGQVIEVGVQGIFGDYVVNGAPIRPLGMGAADITPLGTRTTGNPDGIAESRVAWTLVYYPQPIGFLTEWTIGRGPVLNASQTAIETDDLTGGYAMLYAKCDSESCGTLFPFVRWNYFDGGYRSQRNAPDVDINEVEFGAEWQINKYLEWTVSYLITDRTNTDAVSSSAPISQASYQQFEGQVLRTQVQFSY